MDIKDFCMVYMLLKQNNAFENYSSGIGADFCVANPAHLVNGKQEKNIVSFSFCSLVAYHRNKYLKI